MGLGLGVRTRSHADSAAEAEAEAEAGTRAEPSPLSEGGRCGSIDTFYVRSAYLRKVCLAPARSQIGRGVGGGWAALLQW